MIRTSRSTSLLRVGQTFDSLKDFLNALQTHEMENSGAFEFLERRKGNAKEIVCKCSISMGGKQCPAFVVAEYRDLAVNIVQLGLSHCHSCNQPILNPNDDETTGETATSDPAPSENPPTEISTEKNNVADEDLEKHIYETNDLELGCRFCSQFRSGSKEVVRSHLRLRHFDRALEIGEYRFIPCSADCPVNTKNRKFPLVEHYHCVCRVIFVSSKAITSHWNAGACPAAAEWRKKSGASGLERNGQLFETSVVAPIARKGRQARRDSKAALRDELNALVEFEEEFHEIDQLNKEAYRKRWEYKKCRLCGREFKNFRDLIAHTRIDHSNSKVNLPINLLCTICGNKLNAVDNLAMHYRDDHDIAECDIQALAFQNAKEFYIWKGAAEEKTFSTLVKRKRTANDVEVALFFSCSHSWGDNRTSLKRKRNERQCAAFIKAVQIRGSPEVTVTCCLNHFGHDLNEDEFWKTVKKSLHGVLSFRHLGLGTNASDDIASVSPSNSRINREEDLDFDVDVYWDVMRRKLEDSGIYSLSVSERWMNLEAPFLDQACPICRVNFGSRKSMLRHMSRIHGTKERPVSKYKQPVRCLFCRVEMTPPAFRNLVLHYVNAHGQLLHLDTLSFERESDFSIWRQRMLGSKFRRYKSYVSASGESRTYWTCKQNGKPKKELVDVDSCCPAWVFAQKSNDGGEIVVTCCLDHIGHEVARAHYVYENAAPGDQIIRFLPSNELPQVASSSALNLVLYPNVGGPGVEAPTTSSSLVEPCLFAFSRETVAASSGMIVGEQDRFISGIPISDNATIYNAVLIPPELLQSSQSVIDSGIAFNVGRDAEPMPVSVGTNDVVSMLVDPGVASASYSTGDPVLARVEDTQIGLGAFSHVEVLIQSVSGQKRFVDLSLEDFPLVSNDGRRFYVLEGTSLVNAVSQDLARRGECLYQGDQLTILHSGVLGGDQERQ